MSQNLTPLANVCEITMGQAPVGSSYNLSSDGIPLIAGAGDFGKKSPLPKKHTTQPSKITQINDIILCIRATIGELNWSDKEYCLGRGVAGLRPKPSALDNSYLWHFINSNKTQLANKGTGSTFKQVNRIHIAEWEIPLPPLTEQKRLAAILDKADAINIKRKKAIELGDEFLHALFLDMFGDPISNPKGWEVKLLKELAKVTTGNTPPRNQEKFYGDYMEWIKSDNLNTPSHFLTTASEYLSKEGVKIGRSVSKGSTLVTCIAGSFDCIGNAAYANRDVAFNQQINALTPLENVTSWFLYALIIFSKKHIQSTSTNSMKGMVSKGKMENIKMILPPLQIQQEFENKFLKYLELNKKLTRSLANSNELFAALSQKVFAGQL